MNTPNLIISLILMAFMVGIGVNLAKEGIIKQRIAIDSQEPQYPAADWANGAPYRKEIK